VGGSGSIIKRDILQIRKISSKSDLWFYPK
jgi:hypothetical protein